MRLLKIAGVLAGAILVVSLVTNSCQSTRREQKALAAAAKADTLRSHAEQSLAAAQSALAANKKQAKVLVREDTVFRDKVTLVQLQPVPNACIEFTAQRDSLISECQRTTAKWRGAWEDLSAVTDSVLGVVDTLKASNKKLSASVHLLTPRRYDLLGRLFHPSMKPALFGGLCTTGRPCAGVGVAITF